MWRLPSGRALEETLGEIPLHVSALQPDPGQPDMAVRPQQVIAGAADSHPRQCGDVGCQVRNLVDGERRVGRDRRGWLPDQDQVESRVVESREQILGGAVRRELEPQPRKAIARARRAVGQARQRFRQRALRVADADLRDRAERELARVASKLIAKRRDPGEPAACGTGRRSQLSETISENARSVVLSSRSATGMRSLS